MSRIKTEVMADEAPLVAIMPDTPEGADQSVSTETPPGFMTSLVGSVFEPGANAAVILAMNVCFFLLLLTLFALAILTSWNHHVTILLVVTCVLWLSMLWFVVELSKVQQRPDNMPITLDIDKKND